jgi:hypothetical protein
VLKREEIQETTGAYLPIVVLFLLFFLLFTDLLLLKVGEVLKKG